MNLGLAHCLGEAGETLGGSFWCSQTGTLCKAARPEEELLRVAASGDAGIPLCRRRASMRHDGGHHQLSAGQEPARGARALFRARKAANLLDARKALAYTAA